MQKVNKYLKFILLFLILGSTYSLWFYTKTAIQGQQVFDNLYVNLGQIVAITALILMAVNFLIITRLPFVESLFNGLDKANKFYSLNTKLVFALAWSHPTLYAISEFSGVKTLGKYFVPSTGMDFGSNLAIIALYILSILLILTFTNIIPYSIWKKMQSSMIIIILLLTIHVATADGASNYNVVLKLWLVFWSLVSIFSWIYSHYIYGKIKFVHYYRVVRVKSVANIIELYLEPQNKTLNFNSGEYIFLSFVDNKDISSELHPFGISSNPHEYTLRISVKVVGDYTSSIGNAKEGDIVKLIGPHGKFTRKNYINHKHQIWISGGIGVVPFLSMLSEEKSEPSGNEISFYYATRTREEAVYEEEIKKDIDDNPNINVHVSVDEEDGFLNAKNIVSRLNYNLDDVVILICGPHAMMSSLEKQFLELGLSKSQIIYEDFALKPV